MYNTETLDFIPLWMVFFGTAISIVIALELGYKQGRIKLASMHPDEEMHMGAGVAATLALLAFMLSFTFGLGTDRWDTKKQLLLAEVNAIGTAFLRADLLPEPLRGDTRQLLADYVDQRLELSQRKTIETFTKSSVGYAEKVVVAVGHAKQYHDQLWRQAVAAAELQPTPITSLFINAINDLIDVHQERVTIGVQQRMPIMFWFVLFLLAIVAMALLGYDAGASRASRSLSAWAVAFAFATVVFLVVGLDRPQVSTVGQAPLLELREDLRAALKAD